MFWRNQEGPTVLVGHSFSGMIVTEAGVDPKVSAVVYVAARAPDAGEDYTALAKQYPTPPASAGIVWSDDWGQLSEEAFLRDFAGDLPAAKARVLYALQEPFNRTLLAGKTTKRPGARSRAVYRLNRRPHHQSRSRTLHGEAHGREDYRGKGEPCFPYLAARPDHKPDP